MRHVVIRASYAVLLLCMVSHVSQAKPLTQKEKDLYYTFGVKMSTELAPYGLSPAASAEIYEGLKDGHKDELRLNRLSSRQIYERTLQIWSSRVNAEAQWKHS